MIIYRKNLASGSGIVDVRTRRCPAGGIDYLVQGTMHSKKVFIEHYHTERGEEFDPEDTARKNLGFKLKDLGYIVSGINNSFEIKSSKQKL